MRAFHLTQANSPISLSCLLLRPDPRTPAPALVNRRWTGAPPLFAARIGHGGVAQFPFAQHPLGGGVAPVSIIPADCLSIFLNLFMIKELRFIRRRSSPHSFHRN